MAQHATSLYILNDKNIDKINNIPKTKGSDYLTMLTLGQTSCFYWASKLLLVRGTFWAGLKTFKTSAAAFEGLRTSQPSAAAFTGVPLALPWYLPRPHKLFLLGFETATWHVLGRPSNPQNLRTLRSSFRPWYLPRPHELFLFGTFWQALQPSKPPQQLSKASEPHNPPQQLSVMVPP